MDKKTKYVFIAGPYTNGDVAKNMREAILAGDKIAEAGFVPFIPHLTHFWHLIKPHEIMFWYNYDFEWLVKCDCLVRLPGESPGANNEVALARKNGIPVFFSVEDCITRLSIDRSLDRMYAEINNNG